MNPQVFMGVKCKYNNNKFLFFYNLAFCPLTLLLQEMTLSQLYSQCVIIQIRAIELKFDVVLML